MLVTVDEDESWTYSCECFAPPLLRLRIVPTSLVDAWLEAGLEAHAVFVSSCLWSPNSALLLSIS